MKPQLTTKIIATLILLLYSCKNDNHDLKIGSFYERRRIDDLDDPFKCGEVIDTILIKDIKEGYVLFKNSYGNYHSMKIEYIKNDLILLK